MSLHCAMPVPSVFCPYCDRKIIATTDCGDGTGHCSPRPPLPGDAAVCGGCAHVVIWAVGLLMRKPTQDDLDAFYRADPSMRAMIKNLQRMARETDRRVLH